MSLFSKQSQPSSSGGYQVLNEPPSPSPSQAPTLPRQGDNMSYYSSVPSASPQGSRGPTPGPDQYRHPTANPFASTPASDSEHSYHDMLPAQGSSAQDTLYSRGSDRKEPVSQLIFGTSCRRRLDNVTAETIRFLG
jgi:hypothetical protein